ncbi:MAG TPA: condensation domain-containing protein [Pseudomonadales bacterium]
MKASIDAGLQAVLAIWREVLEPAGEGTLGPDSNFFLCGGDSLDLMRVLARVRERFGTELDLREVGSFSTPRRMAQRCVGAGGARQYAARTRGIRVDPPIAGEPPDDCTERIAGDAPAGAPVRFPCTAGQRGLWLAEQRGGGGLYNTAVLIHFDGELDVPALGRALSTLLQRHEVLRSSLRYEPYSRQLVVHVDAAWGIELDVGQEDPEAVRRVLADAAAQPFDLDRGPLWRIRLLQTGERRWTLLFCLHHAVTDGWSGSVLLRNLANSYRALLRDHTWRPEHSDSEFRRWTMQQAVVQDDDLAWWRNYLAGADSLPSWPQVRNARGPYMLAHEQRSVANEVCTGVQRAARTWRLRPAALFLAALRLALFELTGLCELCIGMPVNMRDGSAQDAAVGYFVNLLVLRDPVAIPEPPHGGKGGVAGGLDTVRRIQRSLDEALRHRHVPFDELVCQLRPEPLPGGNAWCDILFAFQNLPQSQPDFGSASARIEALAMPRGQHPLKVEVLRNAGTYVWHIEYARECLDAADARALLDAMEHQLATLLAGAARSS